MCNRPARNGREPRQRGAWSATARAPARIAFALLACAPLGAAYAGTSITIDSSWGRTPAALTPSASATTLVGNRGTSYSIPGNLYTISQAQGKLAGNNLFHSFGSFSIGQGDAAVFTTTTVSLQNVISRVSGSSPSSINGLLALLPAPGSAPNFFFINPAGVTFGQGAQVDVPAALHVSTANHLRFSDGTKFSGGSGPDSALSIAAPEAFGFLGTTRAPVAVRSDHTLFPADGQPLQLVAGDVMIDGSTLLAEGGGDIRLAAVGGRAVDIPLTGALPAVDGMISVVGGGAVLTTSLATRRGGNIVLGAGDIRIDGMNLRSSFTGISSLSLDQGDAGDVSVVAARTLEIVNGGYVASESYFTGNGGSVTAAANSMRFSGQPSTIATNALGGKVQTGIGVCACAPGGPAHAGSVTLAATQDLSFEAGAELFSRTFGQGSAGLIKVTARRLLIDENGSDDFTGIQAQTKGAGTGASMDISVGGLVSIVHGAGIVTYGFSSGRAGSITLGAGDLYVSEQASPYITGVVSQARVGSSGDAGDVELAVRGNITVVDGGEITASTWGAGNGGSIRITAGSLTIDRAGSEFFTGVSAQSVSDSGGKAGSIHVAVSGEVSLANGGEIDSGTFGPGAAGSIRVEAARIEIGTGSSITTDTQSSGNAGRIEIVTSEQLKLASGGTISTATYDAGHAGSIEIRAQSVLIDGSDAGSLGTGIVAGAARGSSGHGGEIKVRADREVALVRGGLIVSGTGSDKDAGSITVSAGDILVDDGASGNITGIVSDTGAAGNAGVIRVSATGRVAVLGSDAMIGTSTFGSGNAGSIWVNARDVLVDARQVAASLGIQAFASTVGTGSAGDIVVSATNSVSAVAGGFISASTFSPTGRSGSVTVSAETVLIDGAYSEISASAREGSSGQAGSVTVAASRTITVSNGGALAIRNEALVMDPESLKPTLLWVSAPSIKLSSGGEITAQSSGNVAASDIRIDFGNQLWLDPSRITTSAAQGNGGSISIRGPGVIRLDQSQITTSVSGPSGNGGDISIQARALVMNNGFIQANTAGAGASGGNVSIAVNALVASGNQLSVGGSAPAVFHPGAFGLNVIQAAAPEGLSGRIDVTSPVLDVTGRLAALSAPEIHLGALGKDLCRTGAGSSLTPLARGGMRPVAAELIRPEGALAFAVLGPDRGSPEQTGGRRLMAAVARECR
jgi:filamentous hemagglutinin family protein